MARGLTVGIRHLIETMQLVQHGKRRLDFDLDRQDELGTLSRGITKTLKTLNAAELELNELYERTRVTLQSIGDGVITTLANGVVEYLNPVAEKLTGWSLEEAKGKDLSEIFPVKDLATGKILLQDLEADIEGHRVENLTNHTVLINRAGKTITLKDSTAPIHDDEGNILGIVLVFRDITEEQDLQERLKYQATHMPSQGSGIETLLKNVLRHSKLRAEKNP